MTTAANKITINLTDSAPVRIDPESWPVIAEGASGNAVICVRQHLDSRTIVYGENAGRCVGIFYDPNGVTHWCGGIPTIIRRVATQLGDRTGGDGSVGKEAADRCINSLPSTDL